MRVLRQRESGVVGLVQEVQVTPSGRTLAECRKRGWRAQVVEQTIPHTFIKRDLFGCVDIVALDGLPGVLGIQATDGTSVSKRVKKIHGECYEAAYAWLEAGNRLEVWGWAKQGKAGKRKAWTLRVEAIERPPLMTFHGHAVTLESLAPRCVFGLPGACTNCGEVEGDACAMRRG
jgi:hypothetical protein